MKDVYKETLTTGMTLIQHTFAKSLELFFGLKHCVKIILCSTGLNESFQDWAPTFWYFHLHSSWGHMRGMRSGSSLIWVMNSHCFSALFSPPFSLVSPLAFWMKSNFTKWETFKFLCFENNFCPGSGWEWDAWLKPASSNTLLSQVPIKRPVACMVAVGIFSETTGAGQDMCSNPGLLVLQPYPKHTRRWFIFLLTTLNWAVC